MTFAKLTDQMSVAPQIKPDDMDEIAKAGFTTVICNRPDGEDADQPSASDVAAAAEGKDITFHNIPVAMEELSMESLVKFADAIDKSEGPVLAYCGSGTRSTILWSLLQATQNEPDAIISVAANAGYDISNLKPALDAMYEKSKAENPGG